MLLLAARSAFVLAAAVYSFGLLHSFRMNDPALLLYLIVLSVFTVWNQVQIEEWAELQKGFKP